MARGTASGTTENGETPRSKLKKMIIVNQLTLEMSRRLNLGAAGQ